METGSVETFLGRSLPVTSLLSLLLLHSSSLGETLLKLGVAPCWRAAVQDPPSGSSRRRRIST